MNDQEARNKKLKKLEEDFKKLCQKSLKQPGNSSTLGQFSNQADFDTAVKDAKALPNSLCRLPLPKRLALPEVQMLKKAITGNLGVVIDTLVESKMNTKQICDAIYSNQTHMESIRAAGISKVSLEGLVIASRFENDQAPIFTLRDSLNKRLADIEIGKEVPVNFLRPPYECCFIEFGEAEHREQSQFTTYASGTNKILEGAYCINHPISSLKKISDQAIEILELDRSQPGRVIELCFTASPYSHINDGSNNGSVMADHCDIISLIIQDENESIESILEKHIKLAMVKENSLESVVFGASGVNQQFFDSLRINLNQLVKALLYIHSDRKVELKETEYSDLSKRVDAMKSSKKLPKLKKQMQRAYDRVLIGPKAKYIPLTETLDQIQLKTGTRPHLRRGYLGIRWTQKGRTTAKITWVKPSVINAGKIKEVDSLIRDYLVI